MKRLNSQTIASIGILSALSVVISFGHFPIFPPPMNFLEMDFADTPIFIATFLYGPWHGLLITAIVCVIQGLTAIGGAMGILMHFVATGSFTIVAGFIYKKFHTFKGAIVSLLAGIVTWILVMIPFNLFITPMFLSMMMNAKMTYKDVMPLIPMIIAFNAIKSVANSAITLLLYKSVHRIFNSIFPHHKQSIVKNDEDVQNIDTIDNNVNKDTTNDTIVTSK